MLYAARFENGELHDTAARWWSIHHEGTHFNSRILSNLGCAVFDGAEILAITYIYLAKGSELAWIGFTIRNPGITAIRAGRALKLLIEKAEDIIREAGYSIVYTGYDTPSLQKLVASREYYKGSDVVEYWKELK